MFCGSVWVTIQQTLEKKVDCVVWWSAFICGVFSIYQLDPVDSGIEFCVLVPLLFSSYTNCREWGVDIATYNCGFVYFSLSSVSYCFMKFEVLFCGP